MTFPSVDTLRSLLKLAERRDSIVAEIKKIEAQLTLTRVGNGRVAPAKARFSSRTRKGRVRGAVKEKILHELASAGDVGISVPSLAAKLGIKNQNIHVWFATTGKGIIGIRKLGPGVYSYTASSPQKKRNARKPISSKIKKP